MLNLYHVRYWLDAAALGSLAAAARHNHVSQSAVGQAVRALEQSLGLNLTTHERHAFALTEAGRTLLEPCAQLLAAAEQVVALGETLQEGVRGPLDIGMTHTVAASLFSPVARQLRAEYPQVALSLALGNSQVIRGWLADGTVHLGPLRRRPAAPLAAIARICIAPVVNVGTPVYRKRVFLTGVFV
jgi:DNA-binding transcriptional LysR family regulator